MNTQKNRGIHWTDGEGNERVISRGPLGVPTFFRRVLAGHWHDADLLFLDVVIGTEDGFREEMLPFAARLLSLEGGAGQGIFTLPFGPAGKALQGSPFPDSPSSR